MGLKEFLNNYGYGTVVLIDDKVELFNETITPQRIDEILEDKTVTKLLLEEELLNYNDVALKDLPENLKIKIEDILKTVEPRIFKIIENFKTLGEDFIKISKIDESYNFSTIHSKPNNILWIVDKILEDNSSNHINVLIPQYIKRIEKNIDIFILYTNEYSAVDSYEKMKSFLESKTTSVKEPDDKNDLVMFVSGLDKEKEIDSNFLEKTMQKTAKAITVRIFEKANRECSNKFRRNLYNYEYYNLLADYDYISEGKSAFKAFSDILFNTLKREHYLWDKEKINSIEQINSITSLKYGKMNDDFLTETKATSRMIKEYHLLSEPQEMKAKLADSTIDIGIGDLFKIGKEKFLVINQECDLILRENGERISESIKMVKVEIETNLPNQTLYEYISSKMNKILRDEITDNNKQTLIKNKVIKLIQETKNINLDLSFKNKDIKEIIAKLDGGLVKLKVLKNQIKYIDSWMLDASLFFESNGNGFFISKLASEGKNDKSLKANSKKALGFINGRIKNLIYDYENKYNGITFMSFLSLITGLELSEENGKIVVPIQRVAKLKRSTVQKIIGTIIENDNRKSEDNVINI